MSGLRSVEVFLLFSRETNNLEKKSTIAKFVTASGMWTTNAAGPRVEVCTSIAWRPWCNGHDDIYW